MNKKFVKNVLYNLPIKNFLRNVILLESNPDYSDNTYFVFKELLKQKINENYKIIWFVNEENKYKDIHIKNVAFLERGKNIFVKIKIRYYRALAKYIIDSNRYVTKYNKNQYRIHLTHGSPVKLISDYWLQSGEIDTFVVMSKFWEKISRKIYDGSNLITEYLVSGQPRNDTFFSFKKNKKFLSDLKRKKTILWLPTYRQHKISKGENFNVGCCFCLGIPCVNNLDELNELNNFLKLKETILIIKPHPAQDLSKIKDLNCSNIKIIYDSYFENHSNLYEYLPSVDALITDYSSVYFDYLLADKPIGLAIPDLDDYTKTFKMPYDYNQTVVGEKILNCEDLIRFIENIANEKDIMKEKRNEVKKIYHEHIDGNASKRVVELLKEQMECDKNAK